MFCLVASTSYQYNSFLQDKTMFAGEAAKKVTISRNYTSYLDVSQYILKEYSPQIKPSSPHHHHDQDFTSQEYLQLEPIELDHSQIILTPVTKGLIRQEVQDFLDDFMLEEQGISELQENLETVRRKSQRTKLRRNDGLEMFRFECDLDKIIEYEDQQSYVSQLNSSYHSESQDFAEDDNCYINSNTFHTIYTTKQKLKSKLTRDTEEQNKTTVDVSVIDYSENIERFSKNPKTQILKKIKQIEANSNETDQQQKKILIKKHLENYLLETELFCFEEAWLDLNSSLKHTIELIKSGLEQTFNRKIGPISFECRRVKLLKYLQKKKRRIWRKKVSYDCRKKVADGRLRIKGKFVTREQACQQLGLESLDNYSAQEIKEMLQRKMDQKIQQIIC